MPNSYIQIEVKFIFHGKEFVLKYCDAHKGLYLFVPTGDGFLISSPNFYDAINEAAMWVHNNGCRYVDSN